MKTIRWGIIGAGNISSKFATALVKLEGTHITAVAARDLDRAKEFAKRFQIEKAYGSYEELAKDPDIDVIYIGTLHTEHKENAAMCIRNRKAVLCEKPFTLNQTDTKYLVDLAREYNVFLMEAMWTKCLPITKNVKRWIQDNLIGNVKYIRVTFGYQAKFNPESRLFNPLMGGGALLDVGIYPISYAINLMNKLPDHVTGSAYIGRTGVDEINTVSMSFCEGAVADLSSAVSANTGDDALIVGEKGMILVPYFWRAESALRYDTEGNLVEEISIPHAVNGYEYEAEEVNDCLREGHLESGTIPLADTINVMKIMDEIRKDWGVVYPQERS